MLTLANIMDWLLGLDGLSWSDERAALGWRYPLPGWVWLLIVLGAVLWASLSYRRLMGPRPAKVALGAVRALLIVVVAALLAGPMLVVLDSITEDDWLIMLVDRSESMTIEDSLAAEGGAAVSRDEAMRAALRRHADAFAAEPFTRHRRVVWLGFDESAYELGGDSGAWNEPAGQTTALRTAIEQSLQRIAARQGQIAGIVLWSDGQTPQTTSAELGRRLVEAGVPVFAVPLGGDIHPLDVYVRQVDAPDRAFTRDDVPVRVTVDRTPEDSPLDPQRLHVRLIDNETGKVLDERSGAEPGRAITLVGRSEATGQASWRVEVAYDAPAEARQSDPVPRNNEHLLSVELVDRPIRVLYVEGYPRWEYRFLVSLLVREQSIASSMLLLSADRDFAQEGDEPITRLPVSPEELAPYDVVILGDVPAEYLSAEQMMMLRDHVAARGAGLIWIGGAYHTPHRYEGTMLADLLPMRRPGSAAASPQTTTFMSPWPLAEALNVLQLRDPAASATGAALNWPENLPPLYWVQDVRPLKPIAEVLAASAPPGAAENALPLLVRMRFGAGQVLYLATDEVWRYRRGRGELYFGQFWTQLIRMLGRHRLSATGGGHAAQLEVARRRVETDQPIVVELRIGDALRAARYAAEGARVGVGVFRADDPLEPIDRFDLLPRPRDPAQDGAADSALEFTGTWRPGATGRLVLRVIDPGLEDLDIMRTVDVDRPDAEMRRTLPDHARLAALADATADLGGQLVPLAEIDRLPALIQSRAKVTTHDQSEPLWHSPLALLLVLALLAIEWTGRKLIRLA